MQNFILFVIFLALTLTQALSTHDVRTADATRTADIPFSRCASAGEWLPRGPVPPSDIMSADCDSALFLLTDKLDWYCLGYGDFTYRGPPYQSTVRFPSPGRIDLPPRRYTQGTCTIAVMMKKMWESRGIAYQLPEMPQSSWPRTDQASWVNVTEWIGYVRSICKGGSGYTLVGIHGGVVVASWVTDAFWDQAVKDQMGLQIQVNSTQLPTYQTTNAEMLRFSRRR